MAQPAASTTSAPEAAGIGVDAGQPAARPARGLRSLAWRPLAIMGASLCAVLVVNMMAQIRLNEWQGAFFDAIGQRDRDGFVRQLAVFAGIAAVLLVAVVAQTWLQERMKVRLRAAITTDLLDLWLADGRAHRLKSVGSIGLNPDQRIHEDVRHFSDLTPDLAAGLIQSTLLLASFVGILWSLSEIAAVPIGDAAFVVPGYLLWWALGYAGLGSILTWLMGRPLIRLNERRYAQEAELRALLVNLGHNATSVALAGGEARERGVAGQSLGTVIATSLDLARALVRLTWVTSAYGWGTLIVPVIAASPAYFSGTLSLGGLMMCVGAFSQVQQALRWFVDNFARIADWRATYRRVAGLRRAMEDDADVPSRAGTLHRSPFENETLRLSHLAVEAEGTTVSLREEQVTVRPGERVLLSGETGGRPSGLFLCMAGLLREGSGEVSLPARSDVIVLTAHPYLPAGPLKEAACYPDPPSMHADEAVRAALSGVGLDELAQSLGRQADWEEDLTHGEQQLLAVARVVLLAPAWVLLDDALNALEPRKRSETLRVLSCALPRSAIIAGGHFATPDLAWDRVYHVRRRQRRPSGLSGRAAHREHAGSAGGTTGEQQP
ncbi:ABC transporter ATP-binding protein/permease [Alsobacter sp. R-9]